MAVTINPFDGNLSEDPLAGPANTRMKENIPKYDTAPCERKLWLYGK